MNLESIANFAERLGALIFWGALFALLLYFSFACRSARSAAWQANLGMFCGFLGFLVLPGLLAIPLGHVARRRIKRSAGGLTGRGRAAFALFIGYGLAVALAGMIGLAVADQLEIRAGLTEIDRAKAVWAATTGESIGAAPTREDLAPFLAEHGFPHKILAFSDEDYEINPIGVKASHPLLWLKSPTKVPPSTNGPVSSLEQD